MPRKPLASLALLAATVALGGCLGEPMRPGLIAMRCVNTVMGTEVALPSVTLLREAEFDERFGAEHDGYYLGQTDPALAPLESDAPAPTPGAGGGVFLSSHRDASVLPHELAHHVQVASGRPLDEAEARAVARRCSGPTGRELVLLPR